MTSRSQLRAIPTSDRAWLLAALADALSGGAPVLPVPDADEPAALREAEALASGELPDGTALVIRTSGSSGVPKEVALSAAALRSSAEATHERLGGAGQWIVALPTHLISGAQMLVRSIVSGIEPVFFDGPDGGFDPAALLARVDAADGGPTGRRYLSLVPVQFLRVLELAEQDPSAAERLRAVDGVLVGGRP
ncbi:AMP-binding protein [Leucobacter sp. HNU]|uniref:AMP-binding protein n=1 Tax=Leucobacter sp. HNU TaxID=3236805 RepID=UPI003A804068